MEDFYDNFMENLNSLSGEKPITMAEVEEMFREEGSSNYLVVFLR